MLDIWDASLAAHGHAEPPGALGGAAGVMLRARKEALPGGKHENELHMHYIYVLSFSEVPPLSTASSLSGSAPEPSTM